MNNNIKEINKEEENKKKLKENKEININKTNNKLINEDSTLASFGLKDNYNN